MQQHPVPQHISSYEFRLVGDMTLKQFFQVAGGALVSLLLYASPLPGIIKWPLVLFFALLGMALAFLPLEERPLSTWIISFFKAAYSPTLYEWQEQAAENVFAQTQATEPVIVSPAQKAEEQPQIVHEPKILSGFEQAESSFFQKVTDLFQGEGSTETVEISVPQVAPITVEPPGTGRHLAPLPRPQQQPQAPRAARQEPVTPVFRSQPPKKPAAKPVYTPLAAPPTAPERPNVIVGQVLTSQSNIVEAAILEIRDSQGQPVRAVKSNKLGHFMTATPLQNGQYEVITEKDGFEFDTIKFEATGNIIPPILIKAKNEGNQAN